MTDAYRSAPLRCDVCQLLDCEDPRCDAIRRLLAELEAVRADCRDLQRGLAQTRLSAQTATVAITVLGMIPLFCELVWRWGR